jgi:hypothetical protein
MVDHVSSTDWLSLLERPIQSIQEWPVEIAMPYIAEHEPQTPLP